MSLTGLEQKSNQEATQYRFVPSRGVVPFGLKSPRTPMSTRFHAGIRPKARFGDVFCGVDRP